MPNKTAASTCLSSSTARIRNSPMIAQGAEGCDLLTGVSRDLRPCSDFQIYRFRLIEFFRLAPSLLPYTDSGNPRHRFKIG